MAQYTHPDRLVLDIASFVVYTVIMVTGFEEFHLTDNVLPFLQIVCV